MLPWLFALLVLLASSLYIPFHSNSHILLGDSRSEVQGNNVSRVLLLTAHPDDECLFFAPTLLALQGEPRRPEIYSLTMSIGNADGVGETRKEELSRSLDVLGVEHDKRWVIDHPMLQDNITLKWDASVIAVVIAPYVVSNQITTILTFDDQGVSSHPNHYSLPSGVRSLVDTLRLKASETNAISVPRVFGLVSVHVLSKYTGALAPLTTRLRIALKGFFDCFTRSERGQRAVFTSGFREYMTAIRAMQKHTSQLVWFRNLYVTFSRYMWVNEWVEIVDSRI